MREFDSELLGPIQRPAVTNGDPLRPTQTRFVLDPAFKPGKRYDHVLNVGWSSSSAKGFIEVRLNGKIVLPLTHIATLYNDGTPARVLQQLYRQSHKETDVVYQTALRRGSSYTAVAAGSSSGPAASMSMSKPQTHWLSNLHTGSTVASGSLIGVSAADPAGIAKLELTIDTKRVCAISSARLSCSVLAHGWHVLRAVATNRSGHTAVASVRVRFRIPHAKT